LNNPVQESPREALKFRTVSKWEVCIQQAVGGVQPEGCAGMEQLRVSSCTAREIRATSTVIVTINVSILLLRFSSEHK